MTITRGPIQTGIKVGIYGTEGVGKTTFAAKFPGAVFIDTEGSTKHMDVARFDPPQAYGDVLDQLSEKTGLPAPAPLAGLRSKSVRFTTTVEKENMVDAVMSMLE